MCAYGIPCNCKEKKKNIVTFLNFIENLYYKKEENIMIPNYNQRRKTFYTYSYKDLKHSKKKIQPKDLKSALRVKV